MKQAVRVGFPRLNGVTKSRADQWCGEAFRDRPANDLAAEQVQDNSQVNPAGCRRLVRDVGHPLSVRGGGFEGLVENI